jgi:hypothetical protein
MILSEYKFILSGRNIALIFLISAEKILGIAPLLDKLSSCSPNSSVCPKNPDARGKEMIRLGV